MGVLMSSLSWLFAIRPRVTPDPQAAAALERRMQELQYRPANGFHRDRLQPRNSRKRTS
jgi:hypothetical protein